MLWTKVMPRTATTEATTAAIQIMTTLGMTAVMATVAMATRVAGPMGI